MGCFSVLSSMDQYSLGIGYLVLDPLIRFVVIRKLKMSFRVVFGIWYEDVQWLYGWYYVVLRLCQWTRK